MKYINVNSHRGIVNLFAEYVLDSITKKNDIDATIEVTDCGKFFLVNGLTNSKEINDINEIKMVFIEENKELLESFGYEQINVIDTITYGVELNSKKEFWFKYYDSKRPIYHSNVINGVDRLKEVKYMSITNEGLIELDYSEEMTGNLNRYIYSPLNVTSEFPYGYSFNMGRGLYYYGEYITNHLFNDFLKDEVSFRISLNKNKNDDFNIKLFSNSMYKSSDLESMILDNFNFDLKYFKSTLKDYNLMNDLLKPFESKPWMVKDKKKGLIIF